MRFSQLEGARVGVWGAGRETVSFAAQLAKRLPGAEIAVAAFDEPPALDVASTLRSPGVRVVLADEAVDALSACDVVVRSPGVSIHRRELHELSRRGTPLTTATSLWLAEREGRRVIGVTGTKGKSTTAALAHHLARAAGEQVELAGNIGRPAVELLDADPRALAIVELSSYHTADLAVGPEVAAVTNLYREHADWHGSEQAYRAEKLHLLRLEGVRFAILPGRQQELALTPTSARRLLFGAPGGWDVEAEGVVFRGSLRLAAEELPLPGTHNALNLCAALTALKAAKVALPPDLAVALRDFTGLDHRLQTIAEQDGVTWVDDSISTTPESTLAALASFPGRPLVLLAGGQDRGQDYRQLAEELARLGVTVVGLPTTGERLLADARGAGVKDGDALAAADLEHAVRLARERSAPGTVVLLSPAAPSYDHYENFEQRGALFAELVEAGS